MKPKVILTGGAGYIGGAIAFVLDREGFEPIVVDDYSTSRPHKSFPFKVHQVDLKNRAAVDQLWQQLPPVFGVIHLAARALVPESVTKPGLYYENNVMAAVNTVEACLKRGITRLVHSSTCALYGNPVQVPIPESHPQAPLSPYGESKWMVERILGSYEKLGLKPLNLRYFNPAGAIAGGKWGESHEPETHLIPNVVRFGAQGKAVPVYGNDYATPDGTCIRDYIHVEDLAMAHVVALKYLEATATTVKAINVGTGRGYSVAEVVGAASRVLGRDLKIDWHPKRAGDSPRLVADASLMRKELGFEPKGDLETMVRTQSEWHSK